MRVVARKVGIGQNDAQVSPKVGANMYQICFFGHDYVSRSGASSERAEIGR